MNRALGIASLICFGGAALLSLGAVIAFLQVGLAITQGWGMIAGAALLAGAGVVVQTVLKREVDALERRHSQIELLEAQLQQQRTAIDALADGLELALFICDGKASILYANRTAMELFRFDEPVGRTLLAVTLSYDLEQLVLVTARDHQERHVELSFAYPVDRVGLAKSWPQDEGQRVFLSIYDITDLRRLERVRSDFVSNVSHELRTPLTIIRSMAETMIDSPEAAQEKGPEYLKKVVTEVDRLSNMASDLLVLTLAESQSVEKQPCDIAEIFRNSAEQLRSKADAKGIELKYQGPWALSAPASGEQLRQVALNLIDNAISYTNKGRVLVVVRQEGNEAVASVNDTGIGMAAEHVPRIFERFYRVDKGRSRGTGGTGLGLSIVKHIVESHGGHIAVDSALNEGSTFTVRLPMA